ncbi:MAG: hypothetical protein IPP79_22960 [Chitinophagaceae bacterium]|nr:hypothetical protein [Chitinophagaceae bacterium]
MQTTFRSWAKWSLINLVIVAAVGVILRYKIVFPLPFVDQKNLLHGHSHFAFSGWVSMALFTAMAALLQQYTNINPSKYRRLFILGQIANFGMLFSFPFGGYTPVSISFSTLSVIFSYLFAWRYHKDLKTSNLPYIIKLWLRAALFFYVISSLGAFNLAYLMASHTSTQDWYIGSVYFFLHFQYNGWFLFALMGLLMHQLIKWGIDIPDRVHRSLFYCFFISCIPAFFLSALWMDLPKWIVATAILAVLLHWISYYLFLKLINKAFSSIAKKCSSLTKLLWTVGLIAFTIKLVLQSLSLIPSLSFLAFGFRPIVIGYLHLVLLGMVSLTLIGYLLHENLLSSRIAIAKKGLFAFVASVILNEILLMLQGIFAIKDIYFNSINYFLLATAVGLFTSIGIFLFGQKSIDIQPNDGN